MGKWEFMRYQLEINFEKIFWYSRYPFYNTTCIAMPVDTSDTICRQIMDSVALEVLMNQMMFD